MSGAEAGLVIGLISGVIAIIDGTKKVYDAAKDAQGQPEEFRRIASRLPLVLSILQKAKTDAANLSEDAQEEAEPTMIACREKAEKLQKVFYKVARKDDDGWLDRYKKAAGTLVKANKVEGLMEGILKDIQMVACDRLMGTATEDQVRELGDAIREMREMPSSIPDVTTPVNQVHYGGGHNIANTASGPQENNTVSGSFYKITGPAYFGGTAMTEENTKCLRAWRLTDPREDRNRILASKNPLLEGSCAWIFEDPTFTRWWTDDDCQIFWIRGDPGKGKTMMMMALIDEISQRLELSQTSGMLSYFFCQSTIKELSNASAIIRGLTYLLCAQNSELVRHLRKKYDEAGDKLFEELNMFHSLWATLIEVLQDSTVPKFYIMVDALDECDQQSLETFLRTLLQGVPGLVNKVKWVVTSRNERSIIENFRCNRQSHDMSLELHSSNVDNAVKSFVNFKVHDLATRKKYASELQTYIRDYLNQHADGTFLWVSLVCKELEKVKLWKAREACIKYPAGLDPLYQRMIELIQLDEDKEEMFQVLRTMTLACRPLDLSELGVLAKLPQDLAANAEAVLELIESCGSFLTVRDQVVYFVHKSAKDYFTTGDHSTTIFPHGQAGAQSELGYQLVWLMSDSDSPRPLTRNICNKSVGTLREEMDDADIFNRLPKYNQYACSFWVHHLKESGLCLKDNDQVHQFLQEHLLHWLEALSLLRKSRDAILILSSLQNNLKARTQSTESSALLAIVLDARRFVLEFSSIIETAPLQTYMSALMFAPTKSIVRNTYQKDMPNAICITSSMVLDWSPCLQTLEGHNGLIVVVAFSPDGLKLASASIGENKVRLWDAVTGAMQQTFNGCKFAFSPDSSKIALALKSSVQIWDLPTGTLQQMFENDDVPVKEVAFSSDGLKLSFEGHTDNSTMTLSPNGSKLALLISNTVQLWDLTTGTLKHTLRCNTSKSKRIAVAFSPDGLKFALFSDDTIELWDVAIGTPQLLQTFTGGDYGFPAAVFSRNGSKLATASSTSMHGRTVQLWDVATGTLEQMFHGHVGPVSALAFSPDGLKLASGSYDRTLRLWDTAPSMLQMHPSRTEHVRAVLFTPNRLKLASISFDKVQLWDAVTGKLHETLKGHTGGINDVAFSPDSLKLVSASNDETVRLWDIATGTLDKTFTGHTGRVGAVGFSPDGLKLASGSRDNTVWLWDVGTGTLQQVLDTQQQLLGDREDNAWELDVSAITFSLDGLRLVSATDNGIVCLWDIATGELQQTFDTGSSGPIAVALSQGGLKLALSSGGWSVVQLWDLATSTLQQKIRGTGVIKTITFSADDSLLYTNMGPLQIGSTEASPAQYDSPILSVKDNWITVRGTPTILLPHEYKSPDMAAQDNLLAMGCLSGYVLIVKAD
ncbi:hypothetical protein V494_01091 [Pseudogymnoascus sp. VKM F-4513 (FW-928)]|nr:hypothetical protein V494_01091 [Pseudogymnoascus sp. VKM F-4513 (FW-928)]